MAPTVALASRTLQTRQRRSASKFCPPCSAAQRPLAGQLGAGDDGCRAASEDSSPFQRRIATPFQRLTSQFGFGPGRAQMSETAPFFVTLLGAFAVAAVFQLKHLMRLPEPSTPKLPKESAVRVVRHRMGHRWHRLPWRPGAGFGVKLSPESPASPSWSVPASQNSKIRAS